VELYNFVSGELSRLLTMRYSTSFSSASRLYSAEIRPHIFHIYGWVRVADEVVDSYRGDDAKDVLASFEQETYQALRTGFSTNPIIQSFALTARQFDIGEPLIQPFLTSMRMDLSPPKAYTRALYRTYIHGSAEVVGLMCLKVFVSGDKATYEHLRPGAESLGAAFQKVNFLRDYAADTKTLGRSYFPEVKDGELTEAAKTKIVNDIRHDFTHALPAIHQLPVGARTAVTVAARYYHTLLEKLAETPAEDIARRRVRVPDWRKAQILASVKARHSLKRVIS
jgi:phytoene/squalene synthetase